MSNTKAVALKKHNFGDDTKVGYLLLAPWLFGFIFMYVIPAAMSIYYSFTDYNLLSAPNWVGLKNYITILQPIRPFARRWSLRSAMSLSWCRSVWPLRCSWQRC